MFASPSNPVNCMSKYLDVMGTRDLEDGTMKRVTAGGREILIARSGDRYYAADSQCPHMGGDLSKGILRGTVVVCPRHRSEFDLNSGEVIRWTNWSGLLLHLAKLFRSPRPLKTHEVKIEGERILVRLEG